MISALYVLRSHQRRGEVRRLIQALAGSLLSRNRTAAALWVLQENMAARRFYGRLGGAIAGEKIDQRAHVSLTEVAYGWRDLSSILL